MLERFRKSNFAPTLVLLAICVAVTFALAQVHQITQPLILAAEKRAADEARAQVLASGEYFIEVTGLELPEGVEEIYRADNGSGYVVKSGAKGYGGLVIFMVGFDDSGSVVGIHMLSHNETPSIGTEVGEPDYLEHYMGHVNPYQVDGKSGATKTSNALKQALTQAREAYELAKEAE